MKERPILFNADMVRAILDGRKTQTRRPVKPWPRITWPVDIVPRGECVSFEYKTASGEYADTGPDMVMSSPFGTAGDRLWVRETFSGVQLSTGGTLVSYRASGDEPVTDEAKWTPSIHMPRWASRITLEVKRVWVERVQEVTTEGIIAEGLTTTHREHAAEVDLSFKFAELWDSIYAPKGLGWSDNPWVWCCEFRRVEA